ncbi:hypothetical protein [Parafilimonas terrae]|uniref:Uncharacterized protein n=1 Tax=Parafilimonas terrae TaxID=1465490 RepID=A0A1I5U1Q9_9BACT|nr:hypothetical protein [Parafilimonas terrae]SFP89101.1 hypothetical protein SAMN05444277_1035 [Parafilimonas terrae]
MSQSFLNAGLAKRLAEAADCFRDGKYHYFICRKTPPYDLNYTRGYDSDLDASKDADEAKFELGEEYEKFGPYKTDLADAPTFNYDAIQITFLNEGQPVSIEILEGDVDAIILSMSAYDKFLQPYYLRLYGMTVANLMRTHAIAGLTASPMSAVLHRSGSNSAFAESAKKRPGGTLLSVADYSI